VSRIFSPRVLLTIVVVLGVIIGSRILLPVPLPVIQLPAERIIPITDGFYITNTIIATLITDVTLIVLALLATRNMQLVPSGIQNVVEALIEFIYNLAQDLAGHNAKKFFPWAMTIFLLILVSNWWELIPGVDSIGLLESHSALTAEEATSPGGEEVLQEEMLDHYRVQTLFPGVATLTDANNPYKPTAEEYHDAHEHHTIVTREDGAQYAVLTPFVRAATTDLNLTLGLAIITMVMVQFYGFQALGAGYLTKFFNFKGGPVGIFVGLIELISEFAKIISFGFRLFGNIFAGQVLLFVMAFLLPWLLPLPFYGLETFVGFIQAVVFAGLALIFMQGATESHDAEHH
jgi:F-type H+-transporting ATPase subunit a